MASQLSDSSTRSENIKHFTETYGIDDATAQLLYRAEKLQEKGQLDQALVYFKEVLQSHPHVNEARMNVDMIRRMQSQATSTVRTLPRAATISWYGEDPSLPGLACEHYREVKRLPNGRSEFTEGSGLDDELGSSSPKICFPVQQSDQMWMEMLEAIEDGSGLSDTDPTPSDWTWGTVGDRMTITIEGQPDQVFFTNGNSPVCRIVKKYLKVRSVELGYRNRNR